LPKIARQSGLAGIRENAVARSPRAETIFGLRGA